MDKIEKSIIKMIIAVILCTSLVFSFVSCSVVDGIFGNNTNVSQNTDDDDDEDEDEDDNDKNNKKNNSNDDSDTEGTTDILTVIDRACVASALIKRDGLASAGIDTALATKVTIDADIDTVTSEYADYLESDLILDFTYENSDIDGDDTIETLFMINDFSFDWAGKFNVLNEDFRLEKGAFTGSDTLIVYCDSVDSKTVAEAFYAEGAVITDNVLANFNDGILSVYPDGSTTQQLIFPLNAYAEDPVAQYKKYLEASGYEDIKYFEADLSDAEGTEYVFAYNDYYIEYISLITLQDDKLYEFYSLPADTVGSNAVYAVQKDSVYYMLTYIQASDIDYYHYTAYRFDSSFAYTESETYNSDSADFFTKLNEYLACAIACADNYSMSTNFETIDNGFASMTTIGHLEFKNSAMVNSGVVEVPSFLFLRSGPGKSYSEILTNYYDDDSYVKLTNGMPVEVLGYVNTGDAENPVWLYVSVNYGGQEYDGYCSKEWVKFTGVASTRVGNTYDLNTTADDSLLTWTCDDSSIATVDSNGVVTGISKGMVIVTATASSGVEISCYVIIC